MSTHAHHFRIGAFVIAALVSIFIGIIVFGAGALIEKRVLVETYFQESVQGLDDGAMVKFRGVQIGNVKEITFAASEYDTESPAIVVVMAIEPKIFGDMSEAQVRKDVAAEIDKGMRAQWKALGLTGAAFIEIDYFDPERNPPMEVDWRPKRLYLPSAASAFTRFSSVIEKVYDRIEKTNIEGILNNLEDFLKSASEKADALDIQSLNEDIKKLLANARKTSERLNAFLDNPEIDQMPNNINDAFADAQGLIQDAKGDMKTTFKSLDASLGRLDEITRIVKEFLDSHEARHSLEGLAQASDHLTSSTEQLPETVARMNRTLERLDVLLASQQQNIGEVLENLRRASQNLEELTEDAKRNPSAVLLREPPPPTEFGK